MNGIHTDFKHNVCIFLDFWNIPVVPWVSTRKLFRIRKQQRKPQWRKKRKDFLTLGKGTVSARSQIEICFLEGRNFMFRSRCSVLEVGGKQIRGVLLPSSLSCRKMRATRQGEICAPARRNYWGRCIGKWSKGPLSAFGFSPSCLPWPSREGCWLFSHCWWWNQAPELYLDRRGETWIG